MPSKKQVQPPDVHDVVDEASSTSEVDEEEEEEEEDEQEEEEERRPEASASRSIEPQSAAALAQQRLQAYFMRRRRQRREERREDAFGRRVHVVVLESFRQATSARASRSRSVMGSFEPGHRVARSSSSTPMPRLSCEGERSALVEPRLLPSLSSTLAKPPRRARRRIAVVGAGPVGLWVATLIAKQHSRRVKGTAPSEGLRFIRSPDCPDIVVLERRAEEEHCARRNVRITLDEHTVSLLNKHTKTNRFVSGMALAEIERILLEQWRRLGGKGSLTYGSHIDSPAALVEREDWDLVLWAGGRNSLDDACRRSLGCSMHIGDAEEIIVFEMRGFSLPAASSTKATRQVHLGDLQELAAVDLTSVACKAALAATTQLSACANSYRVVLRAANDSSPGSGKSASRKGPVPIGWLWLMGLPAEFKAAKAAAAANRTAAAGDQQPPASLSEALEVELKRLGLIGTESGSGNSSVETCGSNAEGGISEAANSSNDWILGLGAAVAALQERVLCPSEVTSRWVDAAYWSSDRVVCSLPGRAPGERNTPLVLVGDSAMGKPFFLGTTLNIHLAEVKAMTRLPAVKWGNCCYDASGPQAASSEGKQGSLHHGMAGESAALAPLLPHERRYQQLLARTPGFRRRPLPP